MKRILLYVLLLCVMSTQAQELLPYPTDTIGGKVYYRYTVEKSIGLYRISKNFGVSQEAILEANPELRERGLRFEEVILIPTTLPVTPAELTKSAEPEQTKQVTQVEKLPKATNPLTGHVQTEPVKQPEKLATPAILMDHEPAEVAENVEEADSTETSDSIDIVANIMEADTLLYTDTLRLAMLLPLNANIAQRNPTFDRFYDFYAGALLALKHHEATWTDSLGQEHQTFYEIHTYDVGKSGSEITQLIDSGALAEMDACIGPAYSKPVEVMSEYAAEQHMPVIIPFLPELPEKAKNNPYLLKFNPAEKVQTHALMEYLDTLRSQINIVFVDAYTNKSDYSEGIRTLRDSIRARQLPVTHTSIRQILADSIAPALKDSVENILLFHSERYSNVQLLMPYLLSGKHGKRLTILSQYAWQGENIVLPQLFTTVFRSPSGDAYTRYEQDFALYFGHALSSLLPRYDLLGYDLTRYLLQAMRNGTFHTPDTITDGLQSPIFFTPIENGGYENTYITVDRR